MLPKIHKPPVLRLVAGDQTNYHFECQLFQWDGRYHVIEEEFYPCSFCLVTFLFRIIIIVRKE